MQMQLTESQFRAIFPTSRLDAKVIVDALNTAAARYGIGSLYEWAGIFGVIGNETGGMRTIGKELTSWTAAQMMHLFGVPAEKARELETKTPAQRADYCYAHANGNRGEASGDGSRYRGRGMIQLTGRGNYLAAAAGTGLPLVDNPEMACEPGPAAIIACWFIVKYAKILPGLSSPDVGVFLETAKRVGKVDADGRARRIEYRQRAIQVLSAPAVPVIAPAPVTQIESTSQGPAAPAPAGGIAALFAAALKWLATLFGGKR